MQASAVQALNVCLKLVEGDSAVFLHWADTVRHSEGLLFLWKTH